MNKTFDYIVIGGGIVGVATAWQLQSRVPSARILLLEKEPELALHQTGRNSGVIHAGVYYEPGSLKARFCREGSLATTAFCDEHEIPYERCGKLLVATNAEEERRMLSLYQRTLENGIECHLLDASQLKAREPNVRGVGAIYVPSTGIVDYRQITQTMARIIRERGGAVRCSTEIKWIRESSEAVVVGTSEEAFEGGQIIACAGLGADRLLRLQGLKPDFAIVPYRGEYYRLPDESNSLVNHLIYPIPDPALPFLGIHLTRMIDGSVTVGPNALQGFKREGYGRFNISLRDTLEMLAYPGFWRASLANLRAGLKEMRNAWWKPAYLREVRKYTGAVQLRDLRPYPAGVRAQAVLPDGTLVHDFLFHETARTLHVCNAPSPAATSAIPIAQHICDRLLASSESASKAAH